MRSSVSLYAWVAAACCWSASMAGAQARAIQDFDLPAQSLSASLRDVGLQGNVNVFFEEPKVEGRIAPAIKMRGTADEALSVLLNASGLKHRFLNENTVVLAEGNGKATASTGATEKDEAINSPKPLIARSLSQGEGRGKDGRNSGDEDLSVQAGDRDETFRSKDRDVVEVVVTGTHIRGGAPVGSNVTLIGREEIDRTGFNTVQQVLHAMPQNFAGGPNEETWVGAGDNENTSFGSSINLRGLGAGATLVLVNGRRMAPAGFSASFVDISSIPLSAVDRIEVLPDGASAIYGADAVGGVVNIVLRRHYDGAETRVDLGRTTSGGGGSFQGAQMLGLQWGSGEALLAYEYYARDEIAARDRARSASADLTRLGGGDFRYPYSNPGTILVGTDTYAIPAGQNGRSLSSDDLIAGTENRENQNQSLSILPRQKRQGVVATLDQKFGENIQGMLNSWYSKRDTTSFGTGAVAPLLVPSSNAFYINPAGGTDPIVVRYNFIEDLGPTSSTLDVDTSSVSGGIDIALADWDVELSAAYGRENIKQLNGNRPDFALLATALADSSPDTAFNPFADGSSTNAATLEALRGTQSFRSQSSVVSENITVSGPLWSMRGGKVKMAAGFEHREQEFKTLLQADTNSDVFVPAHDERAINSAFAELRVPLVGVPDAFPGLRRLDLSLAGRYEKYSDFGSATTPKVGLSLSVTNALSFRGTWGRSFKAPTLGELSEAGSFTVLTVTPDSAGNDAYILASTGGNAALKEERAKTWTTGVDFAPVSIPNLMLTATYFDINYTDRIAAPPFGSFLLDPSFANLVTLNPTESQRERECRRGTYFGTDLDECVHFPVLALVNLRSQNVAATRESGLDGGVTYQQDAVGKLHYALNATYLFKLRQARDASVPLVNVLNTPRNPVDLKVRGSVAWTRNGLGISTYVNYIDSYNDNVTVPARRVSSWTTVDVQMNYRISPDVNRVFDGLSVALSAQNLFDRAPPFFNNSDGIGYDATNAQLLGRAVSMQVRKSW